MGASGPARGARKRILVVCYGNICRSPIAEALLQKALRDAKLERHWSVRSAGVGALPGTPAARGAQSAAATRNLDLSAHRARKLTVEMAREADLLVALDEVVEEEIAILAGNLDVVLWPVDDPYGGPSEGYRRALEEIEVHVAALVDDLRSRSETPGSS
jgi:protein-tyrosine phosphatase